MTHLAGIEELFTGRYSDEELETLGRLLSRLPTTGREDDGTSCSSDAASGAGVHGAPTSSASAIWTNSTPPSRYSPIVSWLRMSP